MEWKTIRITKEAWKEAKKAIAGEEGVDLDDFLSFLIEQSDMSEALSDYLKTLEEEDSSQDDSDSDEDEGT